MGGAGKASTNFASGGEGLRIAVNPGVTATLIAGPSDSDALGRLGISPGVITNTKGTSSSTTKTTANTQGTKAFGLGLTNNLDISDTTSAGAARATLISVLSSIRNVYQTTNAPPASTTSATGSRRRPILREPFRPI